MKNLPECFWFGFFTLLITIIIGSVIVLINESYSKRVIKAMSMDYCEGTIQGNTGSHWIKCQGVK